MKAALVIISALALASPAGGGKTFRDSRGESRAAADIDLVNVVNNPATETVSFKVRIANMPALTEKNAAVEIRLDADRKASTGKGGIDCIFRVTRAGPTFADWDGKAFKQVRGLRFYLSYDNGVLAVTMAQGDCNLAARFGFSVRTYRGSDPSRLTTDEAPNGGGEYTYTLARAAPAPVQMALSVTGPPQAGSTFMVVGFGVLFPDGSSRYLTGVTCTATLGGSRIAGGGPGGCQFAIPGNAKGKQLLVHASGKTTTAVYRKSVRYIVG